MRSLWHLIWILLFSLPIQLEAQSDDIRITCAHENKSLRYIFKKVKKEYGLRIAYDSKAMGDLKTTITLSEASPQVFLNNVLRGSDYFFEQVKDVYVIRKSAPTIQNNKGPTRFNFPLSGMVRDRESGEALPYANVGFIGTNLRSTSTIDGQFSFLRTPSDTLILAVTYLGYRPFKMRIDQLTDDYIDVRLERSHTHLPAVDIVAELPRMVRTWDDPGHMELDPNNLRSISNYGHADIFKTIQFSPGISSNDGTNADLNIRGGSDDENLILWDGFTIYHLDHLFGVFSTINPEVVKNIQVYKSSYGAQYGGRSSGVLEVTGKSGDKSRESVRVSADLVSLGIVAETPLIEDKMSLLLSLRRSMSDIWNSGLYQDIFNTVFDESIANQPGVTVARNEVDPEFYFYDINAKLDFELSDSEGISFSFFQGADVYSNNVHNKFLDANGPVLRELNDFINDEASWGNTGAGLVWRKKWSKRSRSRSSLGMSQYKSDYFFSRREEDFSEQGDAFSFESDLQRNSIMDVTFRHAHFFKSRGEKELELGYQLTHHRLGYSDYEFVPFDNAFIEDSIVSANVHTVYLNRKRKIGKSTEIVYGGRLSTNSYTDRLYIEPRGSLIHQLSNSFSFSLAAGNYIQTVRRLAEQNIFLKQPDLWVLSDGETFSEIRSFQLTAGLKWKYKGWNVDVEPYFKNIEGAMFNQEQVRLLTAFEDRNDQFLKGSAQVLGLDVFVQRTIKRHSGWLGYSYSLSNNVFSKVNEGRAFPSPFNKLVDLKSVYTYRFQDWELGTTAIYSTGYAYTPLLGTSYNSITNDYFPQYGDDFSARLPDYFRWDVNVSRTFHWKDVDMTLSAGVFNLTDKVNVRERVYTNNVVRPIEGEDLIISESDLELLGIRPNFSLLLSIK